MSKVIMLAIATVLISVNANAANSSKLSFLNSLDARPPMNSAVSNADECFNFSGSWKGACADAEGKRSEESFSLRQTGCEYMEVDSKNQKITLPIGGVFSVGGAVPGTPAAAFGVDINSHWNKERNTLNLFLSAGGKKLAIDEAGQGAMVKEEVKLANGKLEVNIEAFTSAGKAKASCEFEKQ